MISLSMTKISEILLFIDTGKSNLAKIEKMTNLELNCHSTSYYLDSWHLLRLYAQESDICQTMFEDRTVLFHFHFCDPCPWHISRAG